jgi:hypothetical protein
MLLIANQRRVTSQKSEDFKLPILMPVIDILVARWIGPSL